MSVAIKKKQTEIVRPSSTNATRQTVALREDMRDDGGTVDNGTGLAGRGREKKIIISYLPSGRRAISKSRI